MEGMPTTITDPASDMPLDYFIRWLKLHLEKTVFEDVDGNVPHPAFDDGLYMSGIAYTLVPGGAVCIYTSLGDASVGLEQFLIKVERIPAEAVGAF